MNSSGYRKALISLLIILIPLSGGCWNQIDINKAAVATGLGFDLTDDRQIKHTVQVISPQSGSGSDGGGGGEAKKPFQAFTTIGKTPAAAGRSLALSVPRTMLWQHASVYVVGEKMAREGMPLINDFLDRNRNIRKGSLLVVAKGAEASEVLKAELPLSQNPMFDLVTLLQVQDQQIGNTSPVLLANYLNALVTDGIDPILPSVEIKEADQKKSLQLSTMAVFNNDKLVGFLTTTESRGYRWLRHRPSIPGGIIVVSSPLDNSPVLIELISNSISKKVTIKGEQITVKVTIKNDCNLYEQSNYRNLLTNELLKSVESRTATKIRNEAMAYLSRSQELGTDCVGYGILVGQGYPKLWEQIAPNWHEIYPQVKFELDIRSKIRRTGLTIKTITVK